MGSNVSPLRHELNALLNQYRSALQADPGNPRLLTDVGGILRKLGRGVEALACYRDAAEAFMNAGKVLEAAQTCGRILRIDAEDPAGLDLVSRIKAEALLSPESLKQALSGTLHRQRVEDGPPVVVLPPSSSVDASDEPSQQTWDDTIERPMPPPRAFDDIPTLFEDAAPGEEPTVRAPDRAGEDDPPPAPPSLDAALADLPFSDGMIQRATRRSVAAGEALFCEGDPGRDLLVLVRGQAEVGKRLAGGRRAVIDQLSPGAFLGELGLLGDGRRHATVTALEDTEVLVLDHKSVRAAMKQARELNRALLASYRERLQRMLLVVAPIFAALSEDDSTRVLAQCKPVRRRADDVVLQAGEHSPGLYLILLGEVEVHGEHRAVLSDGGFFGAQTLVHGQPAASSFVCRTFCQLLLWPAEAFSRFTAQRPELLDLLASV